LALRCLSSIQKKETPTLSFYQAVSSSKRYLSLLQSHVPSTDLAMKVLKKLHQLGTSYLGTKVQLAEILLKRALALNTKCLNDSEMFGNIYNSLAMCFENQKRYEEAALDYGTATLMAKEQGLQMYE
jgi:tetratricopeptide (TPR) repeat protein